jgi:hypothetical protein
VNGSVTRKGNETDAESGQARAQKRIEKRLGNITFVNFGKFDYEHHLL